MEPHPITRRSDNSIDLEPDTGQRKTHTLIMGYLLWIFGFLGSHRFYYGRPVSGTIYFCTFGLFFIGWIVDLFLIPGLDRRANQRFDSGPLNYNIAWILLTFFGVFGIHRFYMGKWLTGLLYLLTGGLFLIGVLYDFLNLNIQVEAENSNRLGYARKN